ncbi:unnamed protein product [Caenorhabditis sp. 36 PRJEB53466]|nr:unnamed protein product [Caenorhabditis sp. 36 PRJEB53466]
MKLTLFFTLFTLSQAINHPFDFVEDSLRLYVNHDADPCDNFYRHACPIGEKPENLVTDAFEEITTYLTKLHEDSPFNNLTILNDFKENVKKYAEIETVEEYYADTYRTLCETKSDKVVDDYIGMLDEIMKEIIVLHDDSPIKLPGRNETGRSCSEKAENIRSSLQEFEPRLQRKTAEYVTSFTEGVRIYQSTIKAISAHLDIDIRDGIKQTKKLVEDVVEIAEKWVEGTPWALKNNVTKKIKKIGYQLSMYDKFGSDYMEASNIIMDVHKTYSRCKSVFDELGKPSPFCYLYTALVSDVEITNPHFFTYDQAYNVHPKLFFGYPNYYHMQFANEMASKLGYTGFTVGHEVGHTFVDNHDEPQLFPYYSETAERCVQNQYNASCNEFKEISCDVDKIQLDENGADILGMQLAHKLLEEYYGEDIHKNIDKLGVTNAQLFWYSFAFQFCNSHKIEITFHENGDEDEHSTNYVRVNAAAQHPGFQKAFQCSDDSRMMKSVREQCIIYGESAPDTRKRHQRHLQ